MKDQYFIRVTEEGKSENKLLIEKSDFNKLVKEAEACKFFQMKPKVKGLTIDGAMWTVSISGTKPHKVERWSPAKGCIYDLGLSLIHLAKLNYKDEEIY